MSVRQTDKKVEVVTVPNDSGIGGLTITVNSPHTCHALYCSVAVPENLFMCKKHWFMINKSLRDRLWCEYRTGQEVTKTPSAAYMVVAKKAIREVAYKEGRIGAP